jgi:hypothetical protein
MKKIKTFLEDDLPYFMIGMGFIIPMIIFIITCIIDLIEKSSRGLII